MAGKRKEDLDSILESIDKYGLEIIVSILAEKFGESEVRAVVEDVAGTVAEDSEAVIVSRVQSALWIDDKKWYAIAERDEGGDYIDYVDHAADLIQERLQEEFEDDIALMVKLGKKKKACETLRTIAEALQKDSSILVEDAGDFPSEYASYMLECANKGRPEKGLDW